MLCFRGALQTVRSPAESVSAVRYVGRLSVYGFSQDQDGLTQMTAEEQAFAYKKGGKKYISRGLLAEPAPFKCNSRVNRPQQ